MIVRLRLNVDDATRRAMAWHYGDRGLADYKTLKASIDNVVEAYFQGLQHDHRQAILNRQAIEED